MALQAFLCVLFIGFTFIMEIEGFVSMPLIKRKKHDINNFIEYQNELEYKTSKQCWVENSNRAIKLNIPNEDT